MECGGKDAMIVDADADLAAAADAAAWGGVANGGQTCVGIERVYVVDSVRDAFLEHLQAELEGVRAGSDADASYGPITMPSQVDVIRSHVDDGLARGGAAALGGAASVGDRFVAPVVLTDVPEDSTAVSEETFGPVIVVNRVRDADEGVERANASGYGLGGAVFAKKRGVELARRMRSGMTSVNSMGSFAFVPALPFGGIGSSGFGRIHGADGLREFSRAKAITRQRFPLPTPLTTFHRKQRDLDLVIKVVTAIHGRRGKLHDRPWTDGPLTSSRGLSRRGLSGLRHPRGGVRRPRPRRPGPARPVERRSRAALDHDRRRGGARRDRRAGGCPRGARGDGLRDRGRCADRGRQQCHRGCRAHGPGAKPLKNVRLVFEGRLLGGELRHEADGSTDEARWIDLDEVADLPRVPLVDRALAFWRSRV